MTKASSELEDQMNWASKHTLDDNLAHEYAQRLL